MMIKPYNKRIDHSKKGEDSQLLFEIDADGIAVLEILIQEAKQRFEPPSNLTLFENGDSTDRQRILVACHYQKTTVGLLVDFASQKTLVKDI